MYNQLLPGTGLVSSSTDGGTSSSVSPVPMVVTTGEDVTEKDLVRQSAMYMYMVHVQHLYACVCFCMCHVYMYMCMYM